VRVLCFQQNFDQAAALCIETLDAPACYHLARQYEMQERVKEAIQFFQRARSYRNAVRLGMLSDAATKELYYRAFGIRDIFKTVAQPPHYDSLLFILSLYLSIYLSITALFLYFSISIYAPCLSSPLARSLAGSQPRRTACTASC
jgi:hypothetical protein